MNRDYFCCESCLHKAVCKNASNTEIPVCANYIEEQFSAQTLATFSERAVNSFCFKGKDFVESFRRWHPTLEQTFVRDVIVGCLVDLANRKYFDDRNAASVELARAFVEIAEDKCLPFI